MPVPAAPFHRQEDVASATGSFGQSDSRKSSLDLTSPALQKRSNRSMSDFGDDLLLTDNDGVSLDDTDQLDDLLNDIDSLLD